MRDPGRCHDAELPSLRSYRSADRHAALVPQATRDLIGVSLASPLEYADFIRQTSQEIRKFAPEFMSAPRPLLRYYLR